MRVTFGTKYNQMNYHQNTLQNKLNDANNKIASGLKIQQGYQDASVYNKDLKLDYDVTTLSQSIDVAKTAETRTLNTDKTLGDMSQAMVDFKTKLLQAANEVHSDTSRKAIAQDLRAIKSHIINLANTSIGGEYIFGGSKIDKAPFDADGNYYGNNESLSMLISSKNSIPYNITGQDLFFGRDTDKTKLITSNIKLLNQSRAHPNVMEAPNNNIPSEEVFIKTNDTLRDLIGDNDDDPSNDGKEYFYLRGIGPDGLAFKSKFAFDKNFNNKTNATTVQDLLNKIGEEYGNTSQNKVVDVTLSPWGQIQIRDLKQGNSLIEFHMISSDKDVDDTNELYSNGARITSYNQSYFTTQYGIGKIESIRDYYEKDRINFGTTFVTKDNQLADRNTLLSDIFSDDTDYIILKNKGIPDEDKGVLKISTKETTIKDMVRQIKNFYGQNLDAEVTNGKLILREKGISKNQDLSFELKTMGKDGQEVKGIATDYKAEYDQTFFLNRGSKLIGNVVQNLADGSGIAKENNKLIDVSGKDLSGSTFNLALRDHNGVDIHAKIELNSNASFLIIPNKTPDAPPYKIPLYDANNNDPQATQADRVTYRQLMDAITIALDYTNQNSSMLKEASSGINEESKKAFQSLLSSANSRININFDSQGRFFIQDKITSNTKMKMMFSDSHSSDFSENGIRKSASTIVLNANNALTITQPQVNFFEQLDEIIDAVDRGIYRPDSFHTFGGDMRNIGIQNGIIAVDDLSDHIEKMIALNGSHGKTFENIIHRNEILKTQVESMKAENIGIDVAETYNKFANLNNNYNAVLSSTNKINQMSLVNYL